jgi:hypothetical protein
MTEPKHFPPERLEPDVCIACGLEAYACLCAPAPAQTAAELERSRQSRLSAAELESEAKS